MRLSDEDFGSVKSKQTTAPKNMKRIVGMWRDVYEHTYRVDLSENKAWWRQCSMMLGGIRKQYGMGPDELFFLVSWFWNYYIHTMELTSPPLLPGILHHLVSDFRRWVRSRAELIGTLGFVDACRWELEYYEQKSECSEHIASMGAWRDE